MADSMSYRVPCTNFQFLLVLLCTITLLVLSVSVLLEVLLHLLHTHKKKVMLCHLHLCFLDLICICGQMHFIAESLFNYPNIIIICKVWSAFTIGLQWFAYQLYIDINKFICPATSPQTTGLLNMSAHKQKCSYASSWNSLWNYPSQLLVTRLTAEMP